MKRLARILRQWADRLEPPKGRPAVISSTGGAVVEAEGINLWHPDQHGNVIEVEPDLIRQARREVH